MTRFCFLLCSALFALTSCTASSGSIVPPPSSPPSNSIQHIIIMVQENRSFDNVFAGFPGANTSLQGKCKPGPRCPKSGIVNLRSVQLATGGLNTGIDIDHSHNGFEIECDKNASNVCQNDGFNHINFGQSGGGAPAYNYPYAYIDRNETKPYWNLAKQYTLADNMFFSETASSFIAHQMLITGSVRLNDRESETDQPTIPPWGCDSYPGTTTAVIFKDGHVNEFGGPFPCFTWATVADLLDAKSVSWRYYVDRCCLQTPFDFSGGVWNGYRAIHKIFYGPDWKNNMSSPNTNIFSDLKSGKLASMSWVIPTLYDSDHPASGCNGGPQWVTKVVNAIGTSQYWNNTAIVLLWDDWGGWYDNAAPMQRNYTELGFRVPMIVISPFAKPNNVSHTQYEFGSILKFIEQTFNIGSLGTTDASAPSMEDVFDFMQTPNKFTAAPVPPALPCASKVTNPAGVDGMRQVIEHDHGAPE